MEINRRRVSPHSAVPSAACIFRGEREYFRHPASGCRPSRYNFSLKSHVRWWMSTGAGASADQYSRVCTLVRQRREGAPKSFTAHPRLSDQSISSAMCAARAACSALSCLFCHWPRSRNAFYYYFSNYFPPPRLFSVRCAAAYFFIRRVVALPLEIENRNRRKLGCKVYFTSFYTRYLRIRSR